MSSCCRREHVCLLNEKTCLLVGQEHIFLLNKKHVFLLNKKTCLLVKEYHLRAIWEASGRLLFSVCLQAAVNNCGQGAKCQGVVSVREKAVALWPQKQPGVAVFVGNTTPVWEAEQIRHGRDRSRMGVFQCLGSNLLLAVWQR